MEHDKTRQMLKQALGYLEATPDPSLAELEFIEQVRTHIANPAQTFDTVCQLHRYIDIDQALHTMMDFHEKALAELDVANKRIEELTSQLERRHDSSCSKEGERACDTCPECHLGVYDDEPDAFGVSLTPDDAAIFFGLSRIDGSDLKPDEHTLNALAVAVTLADPLPECWGCGGPTHAIDVLCDTCERRPTINEDDGDPQ